MVNSKALLSESAGQNPRSPPGVGPCPPPARRFPPRLGQTGRGHQEGQGGPRPPCSFILWLCICLSPLAADARQHGSLFLTSALLAESETVPISAYGRDWQDTRFQDGRRAYSLASLETGARYQGWGASRIWRQYQIMRFSPDSARLYYQIQNRRPLDASRTYTIDIEASLFSAEGIRFFAIPLQRSEIQLEIGLSRFQARSLLNGSLRGAVQSNGPRDYDFQNLMLDYFYARDAVFGRQVIPPTGQGMAFDLRLAWQPSPHWQMELALQDLGAFIDWRQAPYTFARVESDNKRYDENGYVRVEPTLSGYHAWRDFRQRLPWQGQARLAAGISPRQQFLLEIQHTPAKAFPLLGIKQRFAKLDASLLYRLDRQALAMRVHNRFFTIALASDSLSARTARYLALALNVAIRLP